MEGTESQVTQSLTTVDANPQPPPPSQPQLEPQPQLQPQPQPQPSSIVPAPSGIPAAIAKYSKAHGITSPDVLMHSPFVLHNLNSELAVLEMVDKFCLLALNLTTEIYKTYQVKLHSSDLKSLESRESLNDTIVDLLSRCMMQVASASGELLNVYIATTTDATMLLHGDWRRSSANARQRIQTAANEECFSTGSAGLFLPVFHSFGHWPQWHLTASGDQFRTLHQDPMEKTCIGRSTSELNASKLLEGAFPDVPADSFLPSEHWFAAHQTTDKTSKDTEDHKSIGSDCGIYMWFYYFLATLGKEEELIATTTTKSENATAILKPRFLNNHIRPRLHTFVECIIDAYLIEWVNHAP